MGRPPPPKRNRMRPRLASAHYSKNLEDLIRRHGPPRSGSSLWVRLVRVGEDRISARRAAVRPEGLRAPPPRLDLPEQECPRADEEPPGDGRRVPAEGRLPREGDPRPGRAARHRRP